MVLRRPYAFLIKHFRLIHLIITALFGYLVYKNRQIYLYINSVIKDAVNRYDAVRFINYKLYILLVLALVLCVVIYYLLKYKDKPRNIYILTVIGYVMIGIFMFLLFSYMSGFANNIVEQKSIRAYRDILYMTLFFQYYIVIVMCIRGLGFDIKKFNFAKDVHELNLTEADAEEVEVNATLNTTDAARLIQRQKREFGYFWKEYKLYIISILVLVFGILAYNGYKFFVNKFKIYNENDTIGQINGIVIRNSYYRQLKGQAYVIISFDIAKYGTKEVFNSGNMVLTIGDKKYIPNKNICYKFNNYGTCYKKQYITDKVTNYIFVYEIEDFDADKAYLTYTESYDKNYKVKLAVKSD